MTDLDLAPLSQTEAERLTEGIRVALDRTARGMADLAARVSEAYKRRADLALGYSSWAEYSEAEFGEATASLAAPIRRELVGYLSAEGMSTRAIAPAVGVSNYTVSKDRQSNEVLGHLTPIPAADVPPTGSTVATSSGVIIAEQHHVDIETGELLDPEPEPRKVTGLDGKQYTAPTPKEAPAPRRNPLPEQFLRARFDLSRRADGLLKMIGDDRLQANKKKVAQENLHDLHLAIEALQRVVAALQN